MPPPYGDVATGSMTETFRSPIERDTRGNTATLILYLSGRKKAQWLPDDDTPFYDDLKNNDEHSAANSERQIKLGAPNYRTR